MKELNIIEEEKNSLFNRKEIKAEIEAEITPSREDVLKILSEKFSTKQENIKIKSILGKFGSKIFTIKANIYKSKQEKDDLEIKKKKEIEAEKKIEQEIEKEKAESVEDSNNNFTENKEVKNEPENNNEQKEKTE